MTEFHMLKTDYVSFGKSEKNQNYPLLISVHTVSDSVHGPMIAMEQDGKRIWFPAAFSDVIKEWAKS